MIFILLLVLTGLPLCNAQQISEWREKNRTGVSDETGLLKSWPANGPTLLWTNSELPKGYSSVSFGNNSMFITGIKDADDILVALDMNGKILAHGVKPELIGKDMKEIRDADEKNFIKEMVEIAKTKGAGVVQYKWENPKTLSVGQKSSYVEKVNGVILGCGYYQ